jgi:hypothetical protein
MKTKTGRDKREKRLLCVSFRVDNAISDTPWLIFWPPKDSSQKVALFQPLERPVLSLDLRCCATNPVFLPHERYFPVKKRAPLRRLEGSVCKLNAGYRKAVRSALPLARVIGEMSITTRIHQKNWGRFANLLLKHDSAPAFNLTSSSAFEAVRRGLTSAAVRETNGSLEFFSQRRITQTGTS